jgi:ElaB/YqjD/DUF883 family membrane-anchored ribosome-binding protein
MATTTTANTGGAQKAGMDRNLDRVNEGAHSAVDRATEAAASVASRLGERVDQLSEKSDELLEMKDQWIEGTREYIREKPFQALGIAVAAGYVLSMIMRSR